MMRDDGQYAVPLSGQVGVQISTTVKCFLHLTCLIISTFGRISQAMYMLPILMKQWILEGIQGTAKEILPTVTTCFPLW